MSTSVSRSKSKSCDWQAELAGIAGPIVFGIVGQVAGQSRLSVLSLIVFFIVGAAILWRVDVAEGARAAEA